jgi:uncharacterized protein YecT (DUF1311 family)
MNYLKLGRNAILTTFLVGASSTFAQQTTKPTHAWDVFMNTPQAKEAAGKLLGHCGDAETQDVMNACFAMEFKNADMEMNSAYQLTLKRLDREDQEQVRAAQRAWLQYRDLHCKAVGSLQAGGGSLEPTEILSCRSDVTKERTKEIQNGYGTPEGSR